MRPYRTIMEFWQPGPKFLVRLETEAAPPPVGSMANFQSRDYTVTEIDYSIDLPGEPFPETIYRRNVYVEALKAQESAARTKPDFKTLLKTASEPSEKPL